MAVERNGSVNGLKVKGQVVGTTTNRTKTIDYLNFSSNTADNDQKVFALGNAIATSLIGGLSNVQILTTSETPLVEGE